MSKPIPSLATASGASNGSILIGADENQASLHPIVKHRHYPYPDENVFLVTGMQTQKVGPNGPEIYATPFVARRPDLAMTDYVDFLPPDEAWKVMSCVSLAQLKHLRVALQEKGAAAPRLKESPLASMFGKRQLWGIAYIDTPAGANDHELVSACSAQAVIEHAEKSGRACLSLISAEQLNEMIERLEITQAGKDKDENYASDIAGGELVEEVAENIAAMTPEQREKELQRDRRMHELLEARVIS